jgi:predicted metal-dependent peptidase
MKKLNAEQRIELVHVSLMRSTEFALFAGLFMVGKTSVVDLPITAATNGRDAQYGRGFVDSLTDKELAFLVLHENMHKCYRHLTTWKGLHDIDHSCANQACDYVINIQLVDLDPENKLISMPRDPKTGKIMGLLDPAYRGMDTKQVFDIIYKKRKERGGGGKEGGNGGDGGEAGEGTDRQDGDESGGGGFDEHDWQGAVDGMTEQEKQQLTDDIDQALRQGGIYAGKVGGNMSREIAEMLTPKVNWREVLRRFIKTSLKDRDAPSWRKAHKNYLWQDVILPSIVGKRIKHLAVGIDTSGSIQGPILTAFLSELNKIIKDVNPDRVDVMYWDTDVAGHETYTGTKADIVARTNPKGGGGTDPDCVPVFMKGKAIAPDALVILSDGYMSSDPAVWAGPKYPVLWCIIGNDSWTPPRGQLVNVKE